MKQEIQLMGNEVRMQNFILIVHKLYCLFEKDNIWAIAYI